MNKNEEIEFWWEMYAAAHKFGIIKDTKLILKEIRGIELSISYKVKSADLHIRKRMKTRRTLIK